MTPMQNFTKMCDLGCKGKKAKEAKKKKKERKEKDKERGKIFFSVLKNFSHANLPFSHTSH